MKKSAPLRFPRAILSVSREEFYGQDEEHQPLTLTVKKGITDEEGELPSELHGSVFIIATAGNAASELVHPTNPYTVFPSKDGNTSLLNGDGMVYRIDFDSLPENKTVKKAFISNRLLKTPSFFADRIITKSHCQNYYHKFKFINFGLARISPYIGMSEQVSTALLAMPFPNQKTPRLLATWDVGRPYEIDPDSLKVIAPVGSMEEWSKVVENIFSIYPVPFPQSMSSAHPCFDSKQGEFFTTNIVKSIKTLLQLDNLVNYQCKKWISNSKNKNTKINIIYFIKAFVEIINLSLKIIKLCNIGRKNTTFLMRWNGLEKVEKWKITYRGNPVKIKSTVHQMGISKDYIILTETSFKLVLEDFMPSLKFSSLTFKTFNFFRHYLTFPQSPSTTFYIIPRVQLSWVKPGGLIKAEKFKIQGECNHYLVDYDNPNDKITIHAALNKAADAAEFIHQNDTSPFSNREPRELAGMFSNVMAVNRPAIYVVNGKTGRIEQEEILEFEESKHFTWSIGLYAYRDNLPTQKFEDIYWLGFGAWPDIQTQFMYDLYKDYVHREMPLDELMKVTKQGVPTILCRLHINRHTKPMLSIADAYKIPGQYFANSPQFIPRKDSTGSTDGYIVCTAIYSDNPISEPEDESRQNAPWSNNSELWIFDAGNLKQGPLCRLSHPKLNFSFTIHTTWMKDRAPSPAREYSVRQDFEELVRKATQYNPLYNPEDKQKIVDLFEEVYEAFERDIQST